jgi:GNAT superfamily N-acetyltransferase
VKQISVVMKIDSLSEVPDYPLPAPFSLRPHSEGDDSFWAEIETQAGEFEETASALARHEREFGGKDDELGDRRFYLLDPNAYPIGTATGWHGTDLEGGLLGRLHWVAIVPKWQGHNLAKPLVAAAMTAMSRHHNGAYLTTQTRSYKAVKIYLDFGFKPHIVKDEERAGWELLSQVLGIPSLAQV